MELSSIFSVFQNSDWWEKAADDFLNLFNNDNKRILLLYHADADGFCASYFLFRLIEFEKNAKTLPIVPRPVWNQEFDFAWLTRICNRLKPAAVVCVDLPLIHAERVLQKVAADRPVAIYDHHVIDHDLPEIENVHYVNSRHIDSKKRDLPASYFAASLALRADKLKNRDIPLLACGLSGDKSLGRNHPVATYLSEEYSEMFADAGQMDSFVRRFTSRINVLFKSDPLKNPEKAQRELVELLDEHTVEDAFSWFSIRYNLSEAETRVSKEVEFLKGLLHKNKPRRNEPFCQVVACETFCAGILASVLAAERFAPVVAVGYHAGKKIQFELRTHEKSKIDLTALLRKQREEYQPISSGGHPAAAGALIAASDFQLFRESLNKAFKSLKK